MSATRRAKWRDEALATRCDRREPDSAPLKDSRAVLKGLPWVGGASAGSIGPSALAISSCVGLSRQDRRESFSVDSRAPPIATTIALPCRELAISAGLRSAVMATSRCDWSPECHLPRVRGVGAEATPEQ